jgi:hypothetical protein
MERKQKPPPDIDREAVALFKKIRALEQQKNVAAWEEQGGQRREWLTASLRLHKLLNRKPWQCEVERCAAKRGPDWIPRDQYREAHKLYLALERAANDAR